ncbi:MAG TPA: hypothetical protein VHA75_08085 [Rugosimonospora sp.]|nr:hypothetical protein [Rugosimonospora sp.]
MKLADLGGWIDDLLWRVRFNRPVLSTYRRRLDALDRARLDGWQDGARWMREHPGEPLAGDELLADELGYRTPIQVEVARLTESIDAKVNAGLIDVEDMRAAMAAVRMAHEAAGHDAGLHTVRHTRTGRALMVMCRPAGESR